MTRLDSMAFGGEVHSLFMNGDCLINILAKFLPMLIPLFRKTSAIAVATLCRDCLVNINKVFRVLESVVEGHVVWAKSCCEMVLSNTALHKHFLA